MDNLNRFLWPVFATVFLLLGFYAQKETTQDNITTPDSAYFKQTADFIKAFAPQEKSMLSDKPDNAEGFDCLDDLKKDPFFTKAELAYITQQSKQPPIEKWTAELIPNTNFVSADTINQIFKDRQKGWDYFYKKFGRGFYSYSAPIFFRNNTYCVFYTSHHCGWLCGGGRLNLYKKEGNKWKIVKSYCNWIS